MHYILWNSRGISNTSNTFWKLLFSQQPLKACCRWMIYDGWGDCHDKPLSDLLPTEDEWRNVSLNPVAETSVNFNLQISRSPLGSICGARKTRSLEVTDERLTFWAFYSYCGLMLSQVRAWSASDGQSPSSPWNPPDPAAYLSVLTVLAL